MSGAGRLKRLKTATAETIGPPRHHFSLDGETDDYSPVAGQDCCHLRREWLDWSPTERTFLQRRLRREPAARLARRPRWQLNPHWFRQDPRAYRAERKPRYRRTPQR